MAPSFLRPVALLALLAPLALAKTVTYDFNITWVTRNPDNLFDRPVMGVNGQWPIPTIEADVGDRVVVNVLNQLGDQATSLHFHGLFQENTTHMDGPAGVSQCAIPPGSSFTYNFTVNQPGTYWYHSHVRAQYPDGLRGPFIVNDPNAPWNGQYDEVFVLSVSDWYHDQIPDLMQGFINKANPSGAEPVPKSALFNDTQNITVSVQPGKTYLFRMVNMGAFAGQYVWFEGHNMTILEVDGVYTEPAEAEMIYLSAAQRCSFLISTLNDTSANFPFVASMDTTLFDQLPDDLNYNSTGWLVYDAKNDNPDPAEVDDFDSIVFDDITLVPVDGEKLLPEPDQTIELNVIMDNLGDGANYAFFDNISYVGPKVPTLYTVLSSGDLATNAQIYGGYTNSRVLDKDQVVQIVINNLDSGRHPFHLHGHNFQAIWRSDEDGGTFEDSQAAGDVTFPDVPMRRDTFVLYPNGNLVFRFKANNPGVWLLHCHIEWHVASGLIATLVEDPLEIQKTLAGNIPANHLQVCKDGAVPTAGNAAGNTVNFLDLTGENRAPDRLPDGFTARGIVALVFSCIAGLIGTAVVAWYGFAEVSQEIYDDASRRIAEAHMAAPPSTDAGVLAGAAPVSEHQPQEVIAGSGGGGKAAAA